MPAAWRDTISPVWVEPVNATAWVPGFTASSSPTSGPGPSTKLNTPGGKSASATQSARTPEHTAVDGAGVHTTAQPQASAGASTSAGIVYGQFQGVISPSTPTGRRRSSTRLPGRRALGDPALEALGVLGRHPEELDQLADLDLGLRLQRLALVERADSRQLLAAALAGVGRPVQQRGALEPGARRPRVEGGVRRRDRAPGVLAAPIRNLPERLARRGARGLDGGAPGRVGPLAVDEHPGGHAVPYYSGDEPAGAGCPAAGTSAACEASTPVL